MSVRQHRRASSVPKSPPSVKPLPSEPLGTGSNICRVWAVRNRFRVRGRHLVNALGQRRLRSPSDGLNQIPTTGLGGVCPHQSPIPPKNKKKG